MAGYRARGSNARILLGMEASYGALTSVQTWFQAPFVSSGLGEEQGLIESDVLGFGRMPQQPGRDAVNDTGDMPAPLCARNIGLWYTLLFGEPETEEGVAATGALTFVSQPANNATITVGGQVFTFTTGAPGANQIKISSTLDETIANAVRVLNTSAVAGVAAATYWGEDGTRKIQVLHDAVGTGGNSFTLASSSAAVTVSGATLTGGAATGGYRHTWKADSASLTTPSASIEVGHPEVPSYSVHYGVKANTYGVPLQRSGNLNATLGLIAQGEMPVAGSTTQASPSVLALRKFSAFSGTARRNGSPFGASLVGGQFNYSNGLDPVPTVGRGDGRIGGIDEGMAGVTGTVSIRYDSAVIQAQAENGEACELTFSWAIPGTTFALRHVAHAVYLPKAKRPITGSGAIQADYNWQGAQDPVTGRLVTFVLDNDVEAYVVTAPVLGELTLDPPEATVGVAYTGTISGRTEGSTLTLTGAGSAGLSVNSATGAVTGTPTAAGPVNIIETLANAIGSPRTTPNALETGVPILADDFVFVSPGLGMMTTRSNSVGSTRFRRHFKNTPLARDAVDTRFLFMNLYADFQNPAESGAGAASPPSALTYEKASVYVGGVEKPALFTGVASTTLAAGAWVWSDAIADTLLLSANPIIDMAYNVPSSGFLVGGSTPQVQNGEGIASSTTTLSGSVGTASPLATTTKRTATGPVAAVARRGVSLQRAGLVVGDSIAQTTGWETLAAAAGARGLQTWPNMMLDSTTGGRFGVGNIAARGQSLAATSGGGEAGSGIRKAALLALGRPPMDFVIHELGVNTLNVPTALVDADVQAAFQASWAYWAAWGDLTLPVIQSTITCVTTSTDGWVTQANQGYGNVNMGPAPCAWSRTNDWIVSEPDGIKAALDLRDVVQSSDGKWKEIAFSTTLHTALTAGGGSTVILDADVSAYIGANLVFEPAGGANLDFHADYQIVSSTAVGDGTFSVVMGRNIVKAHNAGVAVRLALTPDGVHPNLYAHGLLAAAAIAQKSKL